MFINYEKLEYDEPLKILLNHYDRSLKLKTFIDIQPNVYIKVDPIVTALGN